MTQAAWNWLPVGALAGQQAIAPLDAALAEWSGRWLPGDRLRCQSPTFDGDGDARPLLAEGTQVRIHAGPGGGDALAGRALGLDLARLEIADGDRQVVDAFVQAMAGDLVERLERASAPEGPGDVVSGAARLTVTDGEGRRLLTLVTNRAALARMRRAGLPKRLARKGGLTPFRAAIAQAEVTVHAHLGSAVLPVADVRRLTPGDVLILDRRIEDAFDLQAASDGSLVACARLIDTASPRAVRLSPPSSGTPS